MREHVARVFDEARRQSKPNIESGIARGRADAEIMNMPLRSESPGTALSEETAAIEELDRLIVEAERSVIGRRQLSEIESLPAVKAQPARNGRPAIRAMAADPTHGATHRAILAIQEQRLAALQSARRLIDSQREEIARLTKEREEAAALPSSRALSEEERCANCGKDYGNHFDGPFCFKNHGSESEDGAQWRVRSTPSNDQKRAATLILALLEWVGYDTLDGDAQRTCDEARKLVDRLTGAPK